MPAPPPKGASSTVPWRSLANRLMSTASSAHVPSFNALPARLSPSGPGNISGKSVSAVARHTLVLRLLLLPPASRPAGGSTTTLPPSTSISGTASSVKGSITEPRDARLPRPPSSDPAPKSWKAMTFPQSRPSRADRRRDRSGPPRTTPARPSPAMRCAPHRAAIPVSPRPPFDRLRPRSGPAPHLLTALNASTRYSLLPRLVRQLAIGGDRHRVLGEAPDAHQAAHSMWRRHDTQQDAGLLHQLAAASLASPPSAGAALAAAARHTSTPASFSCRPPADPPADRPQPCRPRRRSRAPPRR